MKAGRQRQIIDIITNKVIETQEELALELQNRGYKVTQATVSRDIKELGLVKIPAGENKYRYAQPQTNKLGNVHQRLKRMFQDSVVNLDYSENLILIRTLPGTAHAVASCIDQIEWQEVIGTVAGDDTILVIVKPKNATLKIIKDFKKLLE